MTEVHKPKADPGGERRDDISGDGDTCSEKVKACESSGESSKLDYILTCSLGVIAGAAGAMIHYPDFLVGSMATIVGALLCVLMGVGVLGQSETWKNMSAGWLERSFGGDSPHDLSAYGNVASEDD